MAKTNAGLVSHSQAQLGCPYWWGTYGSIATIELLDRKKAQYPSQYAGTRYETAKKNHLGKRVFDCAGLVKSYMMMDTPTGVPKYASKYDKNVGGLKNICMVRGSIATLPETPGILLFRKTEHVGVYIGNNDVIEAKGFNYGVVKSKLKDGSWDTWGELSWIFYDENTSESVSQTSNKSGSSVSDDSINKVQEEIYEMKSFKNDSGKTLDIYAETKLKTKVGTLFSGSSCSCIGTKNGRAILLYRISGEDTYKVGFTSYTKGVKD